MCLKTCASTDAEFRANADLLAFGQLPSSWPMIDGVPAQPTRRRKAVKGWVKPYPTATHEFNGQAKRPGTWDACDESTFGESDFVCELVSPENAIIEVIDNGCELGHFPRRKWNKIERTESEVQEFAPDPYDAVYAAKVQQAVKRSYACARVPEKQMIRLKALRAEAVAPKAAVKQIEPKKMDPPKAEVVVKPKPAPKPVLKTRMRLTEFAALASAIAA